MPCCLGPNRISPGELGPSNTGTSPLYLLAIWQALAPLRAGNRAQRPNRPRVPCLPFWSSSLREEGNLLGVEDRRFVCYAALLWAEKWVAKTNRFLAMPGLGTQPDSWQVNRVVGEAIKAILSLQGPCVQGPSKGEGLQPCCAVYESCGEGHRRIWRERVDNYLSRIVCVLASC